MTLTCKSQTFYFVLTLVLPRGGKIFSLLPQNQKESDQSHLDNLKYILCGHFEEWYILAEPQGSAGILTQSSIELFHPQTAKPENREILVFTLCWILHVASH